LAIREYIESDMLFQFDIDKVFLPDALSQAEAEITDCKQASEDFAILSMWAVFERRLIARLEDECHKMQGTQPTEFNHRVFEKIGFSMKIMEGFHELRASH
jgi:hypothetical protein